MLPGVRYALLAVPTSCCGDLFRLSFCALQRGVLKDTWFAATDNVGDIPMDWIAVTCNDCNEELCSPDVGQCVDNRCVCDDGFMGLNCEFEIPACKFIGLDYRSKESLPALPFASLFVENEYVKLEDANGDRFYDRPIYVSYNNEGKLDVLIVFSGRRWIILGIPQQEVSNVPITDFLDYLSANDPVNRPLDTMLNITRSITEFQPLFFSTPVDYGTESYQVDPINVRWVLAQPDDSLPLLGYRGDDSFDVSAKFICSHCNETSNPCLNDGTSCLSSFWLFGMHLSLTAACFGGYNFWMSKYRPLQRHFYVLRMP